MKFVTIHRCMTNNFSVENWKANMKVIILLTTFALVATLGLTQYAAQYPGISPSICPEETFIMACPSNERFIEYLIPKGRLTDGNKCPRDKKIKKLKAKNQMMEPPSPDSRDCHATVVILIS